jgi:hypothetical protein
MKTAILTAALAATLITSAHADTFAVSGVKGDRKGRTILTTSPCELKLDALALGTTKANLANMRRAFYYTSDGLTAEGCWRHDAGTVLLAWPAERILRRWPIKNFDVSERKASAWETLP